MVHKKMSVVLNDNTPGALREKLTNSTKNGGGRSFVYGVSTGKGSTSDFAQWQGWPR
jgi:hypothetical protein